MEQVFGEWVEWVSVKDRLPPEYEDVLVYRDGSYGIADMFEGYCEETNGAVWSYTGIGDPLYWMPLPKPPKENKK